MLKFKRIREFRYLFILRLRRVGTDHKFFIQFQPKSASITFARVRAFSHAFPSSAIDSRRTIGTVATSQRRRHSPRCIDAQIEIEKNKTAAHAILWLQWILILTYGVWSHLNHKHFTRSMHKYRLASRDDSRPFLLTLHDLNYCCFAAN